MYFSISIFLNGSLKRDQFMKNDKLSFRNPFIKITSNITNLNTHMYIYFNFISGIYFFHLSGDNFALFLFFITGKSFNDRKTIMLKNSHICKK